MKSIFAVLFSLVLGLSVAAQSPSKVIKQAEKAMGGQRALKSITSLVRSGRITRQRDGAEGRYIFQTSSPNRFNLSFDIGGFETEYGFNGRSGWMRNSRDGLQTSPVGRVSS